MNMKLSSNQWIVVGLAAATGLIHLVLGLGGNTLFILNGLGYFALAAGLYMIPQLAGQRPLIRWALLGYTAVTFILYFAFNWPNVWGPMGLITKVIELALLVMLWREK